MGPKAIVVSLALVLLLARPASGYSVLTHEAIIDAVWDTSIAPLLRSRYHLTPDQLLEARSYAYGGCIIQDLGYYPFSSHTFGALVHYVRSGDFIAALLREAHDANEFAFALGALAHFAADNVGHPTVINRAVPMLYPKLRSEFGDVVTYEDKPSAHLKTEFGFDVVQVARGSYLPKSYHDFIGFRVSTAVLERAFQATYGLSLNDVFGNLDLAIGTFRRAVSTLIPEMTKVAWATKQKEIEQMSPDAVRGQFVFSMTVQSYEKEWGTHYSHPNFGHKTLGFFFKVIPKVGPFRGLAFKPPTPEAEKLFLQSVERTVAVYRDLLASVRRGQLSLENRNFDTGGLVRPGTYRLVDEAYAKLVAKLADRHFAGVSPSLRRNILSFYANLDAPIATRAHKKDWQKLTENLDALRSATGHIPPAR